MQIYLGNGDGTFSGPRSYVSSFPGPVWGRIAITDLNLDGKLDIASGVIILWARGWYFPGDPADDAGLATSLRSRGLIWKEWQTGCGGGGLLTKRCPDL